MWSAEAAAGPVGNLADEPITSHDTVMLCFMIFVRLKYAGGTCSRNMSSSVGSRPGACPHGNLVKETLMF
jgi:hypothetical protein